MKGEVRNPTYFVLVTQGVTHGKAWLQINTLNSTKKKNYCAGNTAVEK